MFKKHEKSQDFRIFFGKTIMGIPNHPRKVKLMILVKGGTGRDRYLVRPYCFPPVNIIQVRTGMVQDFTENYIGVIASCCRAILRAASAISVSATVNLPISSGELTPPISMAPLRRQAGILWKRLKTQPLFDYFSNLKGRPQ